MGVQVESRNSQTPGLNHQPITESRQPQAVDVDVAIAGGGLVGLTLACALQHSGLRVGIIEAQPPDVGLRFRRAYAITLLSGRILQGLGVWDDILPYITTFRQIRLSEAHHPEIVDLHPADLGQLGTEELGYVAEHDVLFRALYSHLKATQRVTWFCPAQLLLADYQPDAVLLTLKADQATYQVKTRLLVAADGARSPLRQAANITTQGWQYWQSCITAVIRPEKSHQDIAREHFWPSGPFATLPLPGNRCQIVLTAPHAQAQALMQLDDEAFLAELNYRYQGQLGRLELLGDRLLFPVRLMQSDRYVHPRLALVGDAAHCCHPVGGQGLNLGIRDAAALAEILLQAEQRGEDIGQEQVLKRYERWRKRENLMILAFTDFLDRFFSNRWFPLATLRRIGLWAMARLSLLRYLALQLMTGLSGRLPKISRPR
jgi:2-octaprenyl-6-methoxyphenol hydroxylase